MPGTRADFDVADYGTVVIVTPNTVEAQTWVEEHVVFDHAVGRGFDCHPRFVWPLMMAAMDEGFTWERC